MDASHAALLAAVRAGREQQQRQTLAAANGAFPSASANPPPPPWKFPPTAAGVSDGGAMLVAGGGTEASWRGGGGGAFASASGSAAASILVSQQRSTPLGQGSRGTEKAAVVAAVATHTDGGISLAIRRFEDNRICPWCARFCDSTHVDECDMRVATCRICDGYFYVRPRPGNGVSHAVHQRQCEDEVVAAYLANLAKELRDQEIYGSGAEDRLATADVRSVSSAGSRRVRIDPSTAAKEQQQTEARHTASLLLLRTVGSSLAASSSGSAPPVASAVAPTPTSAATPAKSALRRRSADGQEGAERGGPALPSPPSPSSPVPQANAPSVTHPPQKPAPSWVDQETQRHYPEQQRPKSLQVYPQHTAVTAAAPEPEMVQSRKHHVESAPPTSDPVESRPPQSAVATAGPPATTSGERLARARRKSTSPVVAPTRQATAIMGAEPPKVHALALEGDAATAQPPLHPTDEPRQPPVATPQPNDATAATPGGGTAPSTTTEPFRRSDDAADGPPPPPRKDRQADVASKDPVDQVPPPSAPELTATTEPPANKTVQLLQAPISAPPVTTGRSPNASQDAANTSAIPASAPENRNGGEQTATTAAAPPAATSAANSCRWCGAQHDEKKCAERKVRCKHCGATVRVKEAGLHQSTCAARQP